MKESLVEYSGEDGCITSKPHPFFLERYEDAYVAEWEHFVDILAGRAVPECSGYDGEQALLMADKAIESLRTGKKGSLRNGNRVHCQ